MPSTNPGYIPEDLSNKPIFKLRNYLIDTICEDRDYLLGQVLTIIDAAISDPEQRKGLKDLMRNAFWSESNSWRFAHIRQLVLQFVNKFAPKEAPETSDVKNKFLAKGDENNCSPGTTYF